MTFNVEKVRQDFPILHQDVNGHPLVYFDNGATTQKPNAVIDAISNFYRTVNSNVHRGAHTLSDRATQVFESARKTVADFLGGVEAEEVIWTRGTTEGINLVAHSWGMANLNKGDVILVSELEHHSNIVPWQIVAQATGAVVKPIPISDSGEIDLSSLSLMFSDAVKVISVNHVSNALGTVNPVKEITALAKQHNAIVVIDGAQAVAHWDIDVKAIGCDFYAFSGHKLYGPTGIGVLWGKRALLEAIPPFHGGGEMIETCSFEGTTFNVLPYKFEAGTPNIAGAVGLQAAINYLQSFDSVALENYERALLSYLEESMLAIDGVKAIGQANKRIGVFSFLLEGAHPSDLGMLLDEQGIAVRTGHHCAQPLMRRLGIPGTVRASLALYNTREEIDRLVEGVIKAKNILC